MQDPTLVLRDIHQPPAPSWWPLAPGWWLIVAMVVIVSGLVVWWLARRKRRARALMRLFDDAVDAAPTAPEQIATMSELLRRAARRRDPHADRLQGDAWLAFLDRGQRQPMFAQENGRLLLEGGYRREADPHQVAALRAVARARFLDWMTS